MIIFLSKGYPTCTEKDEASNDSLLTEQSEIHTK